MGKTGGSGDSPSTRSFTGRKEEEDVALRRPAVAMRWWARVAGSPMGPSCAPPPSASLVSNVLLVGRGCNTSKR
jgi:hypothetical protein